MYNSAGKYAVRFAYRYVRRRYRGQIRAGIGIAAVVIGIAAYLASRNVPEG